MDNIYNKSHSDKEKLVEIQPEFLYLTIPANYICTYHKLLVYLADFGKKLLDDCSSSCKGNNKTLIDCWNLFQSALACRTLGDIKKADLFINYIDKQLECIYKSEPKDVYNGGYYYPITPDGLLKALCSCNDLNTKFYVDENTGELYQEYLNNKDSFSINDNNLIVESNNKI